MEKNIGNSSSNFPKNSGSLIFAAIGVVGSSNHSSEISVLLSYEPRINKTTVQNLLIRLLLNNALNLDREHLNTALYSLLERSWPVDKETFILATTCLAYLSQNVEKKYLHIKNLSGIGKSNSIPGKSLAEACLAFLNKPLIYNNPNQFVLEVNNKSQEIDLMKNTGSPFLLDKIFFFIQSYPDVADRYMNVLLGYLNHVFKDYPHFKKSELLNRAYETLFFILQLRPNLAEPFTKLLNLLSTLPEANAFCLTCIVSIIKSRPELANDFLDTIIANIIGENAINNQLASDFLPVLLNTRPDLIDSCYELIKPKFIEFLEQLVSDQSLFSLTRTVTFFEKADAENTYKFILLILTIKPALIIEIEKPVQQLIDFITAKIRNCSYLGFITFSRLEKIFLAHDPSFIKTTLTPMLMEKNTLISLSDTSKSFELQPHTNDATDISILLNYDAKKNQTTVKNILIKLLLNHTANINQTDLNAALTHLLAHPNIDAETGILALTCLAYFSHNLKERDLFIKRLSAINKIDAKLNNPLAKICLSFLENPLINREPSQFVLKVNERMKELDLLKKKADINYFYRVRDFIQEYPDVADNYMSVILGDLADLKDSNLLFCSGNDKNFVSLVEARPELTEHLIKPLIFLSTQSHSIQAMMSLIKIRSEMASYFVDPIIHNLIGKNALIGSLASEHVSTLLNARPDLTDRCFELIRLKFFDFVQQLLSVSYISSDYKLLIEKAKKENIFSLISKFIEIKPALIKEIQEPVQQLINFVTKEINDGADSGYFGLSQFGEMLFTCNPSFAKKIIPILKEHLDDIHEERKQDKQEHDDYYKDDEAQKDYYDPEDDEYKFICENIFSNISNLAKFKPGLVEEYFTQILITTMSETKNENIIFDIIITIGYLIKDKPNTALTIFLQPILQGLKAKNLFARQFSFFNAFKYFTLIPNTELNADLIQLLELAVHDKDIFLGVSLIKDIKFPVFAEIQPELVDRYMNILREWIFELPLSCIDFSKIKIFLNANPFSVEKFIAYQDEEYDMYSFEKFRLFHFILKCTPDIINVRPDLTECCLTFIKDHLKVFGHFCPKEFTQDFYITIKSILDIDEKYSEKIWELLLELANTTENKNDWSDVIFKLIGHLSLDKIEVKQKKEPIMLIEQNVSDVVHSNSQVTPMDFVNNNNSNPLTFWVLPAEKQFDASDSDESKNQMNNQP